MRFAVKVWARALVETTVHVDAASEVLAEAMVNLAVKKDVNKPHWSVIEVHADTVSVEEAEEEQCPKP